MSDKILFFLSEILSAKTLFPIIKECQQQERFSVKILNDGFCSDFVSSLGVQYDLLDEEFFPRILYYVQWADLIVTGKTYVQPSEYHLIESAHNLGKPLLLVVPDMGGDIVKAKLRGFDEGNGEGPPVPPLLLADERTRASLIESGFPTSSILAAGNPYFDELYASIAVDDSVRPSKEIGYFSTPFELDFIRGILPAAYLQADLISDIKEASSCLGISLVAKRHPELDQSLFLGMETYEGSPLDMIREIRVAVGSYSTTLLEAYVAGVPAISYQPWPKNIRQDVFEGRIPIVKTKEELKIELSRAIAQSPARLRRDRAITFNQGRALQAIMEIMSTSLEHP